MKFRGRLVLLGLVLLASHGSSTYSQKLETRPPSTDLLLEVGFVKGVRPAFQPVSWENKKYGSWYARFSSVGKADPSDQRVHAVKVVPFVEGAGVRVNVSVLRGRFHETEDTVGSYFMEVGQKFTVEELRTVGVVPFDLRVFRVTAGLANTPAFVYRTRSVDVVSFEALPTTLPTYKVTVLNSSNRNISAMSIEVLSGEKRRHSSLPQGKEGNFLVPAGGYGEFEARVPIDAERNAEGFGPAPKHDYQIVINALVFEDGRYEGDAKMAAMFQAFVLGRKVELRRINPVLEAASQTADAKDSAAKLVADLKALTSDLSEEDLLPLLKQFPEFKYKLLKDATETAIHGTRKQLIDQAQRFVNRSDLDPNDFREWLFDVKTRYAAWLGRLQ